MKSLLLQIQLTVDSQKIPPCDTKSWPIFVELIHGCTRRKLRAINDSYHGAPLEDIEGKKYGYWLVDRYKDEDGSKCLRLNHKHLAGCKALDAEARAIRRKERAKKTLKKAQQEVKRLPRALMELNEAQKEYLLSLGDAVNDADVESKKPTKD